MAKWISIFTLLCVVGFAVCAGEEASEYHLMYNSILTNDLKNLSTLLDNCEDINQVVYDGHHVFECIFIMENCEAAEMLLKAGLDLGYKNEDGKTLKRMILETDNRTLRSFISKYKKK